jgi:hypothetical protein
MPLRRRNRIKNMTPAQREAREKWNTARRWLSVVAVGISGELKELYDRDDYTSIMGIMRDRLYPAIEAAEFAEKAYDAAISRRKSPAKKKAA